MTFCDIEHGGWRPKCRKAEDGTIQPPYQLTKTPPLSYRQRTEWNARNANGTVIFTVTAALVGG